MSKTSKQKLISREKQKAKNIRPVNFFQLLTDGAADLLPLHSVVDKMNFSYRHGLFRKILGYLYEDMERKHISANDLLITARQFRNILYNRNEPVE